MTVPCDWDRILQVFSNLIGNAIKFTSHVGEVGVRVEHKCHGEIEFCVWDTGPGIPAENIPHLFKRYWQAEKTSGMGTGLGLFIVKTIIEAHGGRIWVESALGKGAKFYFTLSLLSGA